MSFKQAWEFLERLRDDEELAQRVREAQDAESIVEIARQEGYEFHSAEIALIYMNNYGNCSL